MTEADTRSFDNFDYGAFDDAPVTPAQGSWCRSCLKT